LKRIKKLQAVQGAVKTQKAQFKNIPEVVDLGAVNSNVDLLIESLDTKVPFCPKPLNENS
jgi:hypothetical protein